MSDLNNSAWLWKENKLAVSKLPALLLRTILHWWRVFRSYIVIPALSLHSLLKGEWLWAEGRNSRSVLDADLTSGKRGSPQMAWGLWVPYPLQPNNPPVAGTRHGACWSVSSGFRFPISPRNYSNQFHRFTGTGVTPPSCHNKACLSQPLCIQSVPKCHPPVALRGVCCPPRPLPPALSLWDQESAPLISLFLVTIDHSSLPPRFFL